jgi:DNA replication protein DnaC
VNLHSVEVREAAGVESLDIIDPTSLEQYDADIIRRTYRPTREEAKRASVTVVRTLGDALRQHRRIVILGGPGSGKTTIGRWLALQLARAVSRQLDVGSPQSVQVPISQIDPDDRRVDEDLLDLGPARLPIFLRLAHFARELADRERQQQPSSPFRKGYWLPCG